MSQLKQFLHSERLEIKPSLGDGHCLLYSVCASYKNQLSQLLPLNKEDLINIIEKELLDHSELYLGFYTKSREEFFSELSNYIKHKRYNSDICDIIPIVIANALKLKLNILNEKRHDSFETTIVEPFSASNTGVLFIHRKGDHYNGVVYRVYPQTVQSALHPPSACPPSCSTGSTLATRPILYRSSSARADPAHCPTRAGHTRASPSFSFARVDPAHCPTTRVRPPSRSTRADPSHCPARVRPPSSSTRADPAHCPTRASHTRAGPSFSSARVDPAHCPTTRVRPPSSSTKADPAHCPTTRVRPPSNSTRADPAHCPTTRVRPPSSSTRADPAHVPTRADSIRAGPPSSSTRAYPAHCPTRVRHPSSFTRADPAHVPTRADSIRAGPPSSSTRADPTHCPSRANPSSSSTFNNAYYTRDNILLFQNHCIPIKRSVRKSLFQYHIWKPKCKHNSFIRNKAGNEPKSAINADVCYSRNNNARAPFGVKSPRSSSIVPIQKDVILPTVKFGLMNVQSLNNKYDFVADHIVENKLDIVSITETWLSPKNDLNSPCVAAIEKHGYKFIHRPRCSGRGGGVAVVVNKTLNCCRCPDFDAKSFETIELLITAISHTIRLVVIYRMPPSKANKLCKTTFITEFKSYLEHLRSLSGTLLIAGDFNINWIDSGKSNCELVKFRRLLNSYRLEQFIDVPTHDSDHLIDYITSSADFVTNVTVSDRMSDHYALHCMLSCSRPHKDNKLVYYRQLHKINKDTLHADLEAISLDLNDTDVNTVVEKYNKELLCILNKHAPEKCKKFAVRDMREWMTEEVHSIKRAKRKSERVWRKSKLTVHRLIFKEHCLKLKVAITKAKTHHYQQSILDCNGDQSKLFKCVNSLLGRSKQCALPPHDSPASLSTHFNDYFIDKIKTIREEFPILQSTLPNYVCPESSTTCEPTNCQFLDFTPVTLPEIKTIISQMNITTCPLDPFPTSVLIDSNVWLDWLVHIVNMSLSTGIFPEPLKTAIVKPLLKKPTLDCTSFRNFRPVSNIAFMSKVIEKVIAFQLHSHMTRHNMFEELQSAYKTHHSTETTLVKVFNDIMLNVDSGLGSFLILLDLSSAFDTIDYDLLCTVFERHLGISGTALKLLKSFLTGRSQAVIIDGVKSELKKLTCGVPQGSVLGPFEFCNYLIPLGNILKYHNVQYHMYADDTQVYISFKLKTPHEAVDTINECISDLRTWMINHKLKINDSKTEFLIIRSQFSKVTLPKLTVTVGDTEISSSDKARNLGVIFDSFMNLEPHFHPGL